MTTEVSGRTEIVIGASESTISNPTPSGVDARSSRYSCCRHVGGNGTPITKCPFASDCTDGVVDVFADLKSWVSRMTVALPTGIPSGVRTVPATWAETADVDGATEAAAD